MGIWDTFYEKAQTLFGNEVVKPKPKKKCYYELLEVDKYANDEDIKRAYKKMALKWHPDKNPERQEECAAYFVLLQQAYEVLIDPNERAFYDKHRENIIYGGDNGTDESKDTGINLAPYFEKNCFKGYGDDEKSFYSIYGELFHKLSAEEYAYIEEFEERNFPVFGKANSDYGLIVNQFYGFWKDYSTKRSFAWLDKYDLRQSPDSRTTKIMQRENQKLRDEGKKIRTNQIRELVAHIRSLDERVKKNRDYLEKKAKEQYEMAEKQRRLDIKKNLEELSLNKYEMTVEEREQHQQNLKEIEEELDAEFGKTTTMNNENINSSDSENNYLNVENEQFYCVICEKPYKNGKMYENHQKSRKHKQMVEEVRRYMKDEDKHLFGLIENIDVVEENEKEENEKDNNEIFQLTTLQQQKTSNKRAKKKKANRMNINNNTNTNTTTTTIIENELLNNSEVVEPLNQKNVEENENNIPVVVVEESPIQSTTKNDPHIMLKKEIKKKTTKKINDEVVVKNSTLKDSICQVCSEEFESRTKLFKHIRDSGHAAIKTTNETTTTKKKKKTKK